MKAITTFQILNVLCSNFGDFRIAMFLGSCDKFDIVGVRQIDNLLHASRRLLQSVQAADFSVMVNNTVIAKIDEEMVIIADNEQLGQKTPDIDRR